ncbi:MAG: amidohydrolase family protein [Acidobacteriota bacterium]
MDSPTPDAPPSPRRRAWRIAGRIVNVAGNVALAFALLVALFIVLPPPAPPAPAPPPDGALAIVGATVVDVVAGALRDDQTVIVEAGRIAQVGPRATTAVPGGAVTLDGRGRFVMPGLWDMHVHLATAMAPQMTLPLFVANGVTSVREMGDGPSVARKRRWQQAIRDDDLLGPAIVALPIAVIGRHAAENRDDFGAHAERAAERGEFLKVYDALLPAQHAALLDAARARGVSVVGHRPRSVAAIDAARAGQRSIEHARLFLFEAFAGSDTLRARYARAYDAVARGEMPDDRVPLDTDLMRAMLDEHDPARFAAIVNVLVEHDTWFCPTHLTREMDARADDPAYRSDPRLRYVHVLQRRLWRADADGMVTLDPSPRGRQTFRDVHAKALQLTGAAHRAGVRILAGTDANDSYVVPGFSLHDELALLVEAGLTPAEALRTATVNPAAFFGRAGLHGVVAPGAAADLLVLSADPLRDIGHTRAIDAVIVDGALYRRGALDAMLASAARRAYSPRVGVKMLWFALVDG